MDTNTVDVKSKKLTLIDSLNIALENNLDLKIEKYNLTQAEIKLSQAISVLLPTISVGSGYTKFEESTHTDAKMGATSIPDDKYDFDITLTQPLFRGGRDWILKNQAKLNFNAFKYQLEAIKQQVLFNVCSVFFKVLQAEGSLAIYREAQQLMATHLAAVQTKYSVGQVPKTELLRAEMELANAEQELIQAENDLVGKAGVTSTVLRPSGKIIIDDEIYDATALTGFIEKGESIVVVKYETAQLFVRKS